MASTPNQGDFVHPVAATSGNRAEDNPGGKIPFGNGYERTVYHVEQPDRSRGATNDKGQFCGPTRPVQIDVVEWHGESRATGKPVDSLLVTVRGTDENGRAHSYRPYEALPVDAGMKSPAAALRQIDAEHYRTLGIVCSGDVKNGPDLKPSDLKAIGEKQTQSSRPR